MRQEREREVLVINSGKMRFIIMMMNNGEKGRDREREGLRCGVLIGAAATCGINANE